MWPIAELMISKWTKDWRQKWTFHFGYSNSLFLAIGNVHFHPDPLMTRTQNRWSSDSLPLDRPVYFSVISLSYGPCTLGSTDFHCSEKYDEHPTGQGKVLNSVTLVCIMLGTNSINTFLCVRISCSVNSWSLNQNFIILDALIRWLTAFYRGKHEVTTRCVTNRESFNNLDLGLKTV